MNNGSAPQDALERRYRWLLLAYPRHYRRYRGEEMLTTLLDGAAAGQKWPTPRTAVGLMAGGFRCRARLGRIPAARIGATYAAIVCAVLAGTAGAWVAWHLAAPPLPDERTAATIAAEAVPGTPENRIRYPVLFGREQPEEGRGKPSVYTTGSVQFTYPGGRSVVDAAGDRLRENGWSVAQVRVDPPHGPASLVVRAEKGSVRMAVEDGRYAVRVRIERAEPPAVSACLGLGLLVGAVAGWLLAAGVSRRLARQVLERQATAGVLAFAALGISLAVCVLIGKTFLDRYWHPDVATEVPRTVPPWTPLMGIGGAGALAITALLTVAIVVVSALPERRHHRFHVPA